MKSITRAMSYSVGYKGAIYGFRTTDFRSANVKMVSGTIVKIVEFRDFGIAVYVDERSKKRIIILG